MVSRALAGVTIGKPIPPIIPVRVATEEKVKDERLMVKRLVGICREAPRWFRIAEYDDYEGFRGALARGHRVNGALCHFRNGLPRSERAR